MRSLRVLALQASQQANKLEFCVAQLAVLFLVAWPKSYVGFVKGVMIKNNQQINSHVIGGVHHKCLLRWP